MIESLTKEPKLKMIRKRRGLETNLRIQNRRIVHTTRSNDQIEMETEDEHM